VRINLNQDNRIEASSAYVSGRFQLASALDGQLDLHYQDTRVTAVTDQSLLILPGPVIPIPRTASDHTYRELNPRVGLKWMPDAAQTVRLAAQIWRKPAAINTLAPIDTVGIPLDDRVQRDAGRLKRLRVQHEIEWGRATFMQWFADYKEIKNPDDPGGGIVPDLQLDQLERLRNRRRVYGVRMDYLEDTPKFGAGRISSAGVAGNRLLSREISLTGRYIYADTENTTPAFQGLSVPYHPRHYFGTALNWQPYARWVVGPLATYRSGRFQDEANTEPLTAGWSFGLHGYWESADKRWSLAAVVDNLHSDKQSSMYRHSTVNVQAGLRF
jgi:hypothetical protein